MMIFVLMALLAQQPVAPANPNVAVVQKFWDAFNRSAWEDLDALVTPDYVHHTNGNSVPLARFKTGGAQVHSGLASYKLTIVDVVAAGDRVSIRWTATGVHQGSMYGEKPTGRTVTAYGMHIHRLVNGKIAEDWEVIDTGAFQRQLAQ